MNGFKWNWQQKDCPNFFYDENALKDLEVSFLKKSSENTGILKHVSSSEKEMMIVEI